MNAIIRKIEPDDNPEIAAVIRNVLIEHNVPKIGTAYADASLDCMYETYNKEKSAYYIVQQNSNITGGAGIAPLQNGPADTCELQKMYFLKTIRGTGIGAQIMEQCLQSASDFGFANCYLETMPYMHAAQKLYKKYGFEYLDEPLGNTGHSSCPVWMIKKL